MSIGAGPHPYANATFNSNQILASELQLRDWSVTIPCEKIEYGVDNNEKFEADGASIFAGRE